MLQEGKTERFLFFYNSCLVVWSVLYHVPNVFFLLSLLPDLLNPPTFSFLLFILLLLVRLRHVQA